jgi:phage terminase large subunit GpA-like protein
MLSLSMTTDYAELVRKAFSPPEAVTVTEWADKYRILPGSGTAEPGPWRTSRTPYLREIMDALSPGSGVRELVFAKGSQIGGTEATILNFLGHMMMVDPGPTLVVLPSEELTKQWSLKKLAPMIENTPELSEMFGKSQRNSKNALLHKGFPGGYIKLAWSTSAGQLKSDAMRNVLFDEVDSFVESAGRDGDPIALARARTKTFSGNEKIIGVSTPTLKARSRIWAWYLEGDQRHYYVPCPHCGESFVLSWDLMKWDEGDPSSACQECPSCRCLVEESSKHFMLPAGQWIPHAESRAPHMRSYHLSGLYSPLGWYSWADAVEEYERAYNPTVEEQSQADHLNLKQVFWNTACGLPYEAEETVQQDWRDLFHRRASYPIGTVPAEGAYLTAGVDVQGDRIEAEIVAWGTRKRSWSVDYVKVFGNPSQQDTWDRFQAEVVEREFAHELGGTVKIDRFAIDSGFSTSEVYSYGRAAGFVRCMVVKGSSQTAQLISTPKVIGIDAQGRRAKAGRGVYLWNINVDLLKDRLFQWLTLDRPLPGEPIPDGWCAFPEYDELYFRGLCAEAREPNGKWVKKFARNEPLDLRIYALAAMMTSRFSKWTDLVIEQKIASIADLEKSGKVSRVRKYRDSSYLEE